MKHAAEENAVVSGTTASETTLFILPNSYNTLGVVWCPLTVLDSTGAYKGVHVARLQNNYIKFTSTSGSLDANDQLVFSCTTTVSVPLSP